MGKVKSRRSMTYALSVTATNKNRSHSAPIQILTEGRHRKGKETRKQRTEMARITLLVVVALVRVQNLFLQFSIDSVLSMFCVVKFLFGVCK